MVRWIKIYDVKGYKKYLNKRRGEIIIINDMGYYGWGWLVFKFKNGKRFLINELRLTKSTALRRAKSYMRKHR